MKVRPKQQQLLREAYKMWPDTSTGYICVVLERAARNLDLSLDAGYCMSMKQMVAREIPGSGDVFTYLGIHVGGSGGFEAVCKLPEVVAKRMDIWRLLFTKYQIPLEELK